MIKIISFSVFFTTLLFLASVNAASVQCAKVGRSYYPVSADAVRLAEHLEVKTCSGKTYKAALEQLGAEMDIVPAPMELTNKLAAIKAEKVKKKIGAFKF